MNLSKITQLWYGVLCAMLFASTIFSQENPSTDHCDRYDNPLEYINQELDQLKQLVDIHSKEEISLEGVQIKPLLHEMMTYSSGEPSDNLIQCYEKLKAGSDKLTFSELIHILPEMVSYLSDQSLPERERAPRPGASSPTANNAIVGKNGCDLTPVLSLLGAIKQQIKNLEKTICKKIEDLEEVICDKFEATWTALDGVEEALCDKFEATWTALDGVEEALCDKFEATWTVLDDIDADIFATQTILCDKFEATWTVLDNICDKIEDLQDCTLITSSTIITEPGTYCLANDINGTITIASSGVFLDINEKTLTGESPAVLINPDNNNIEIRNGIVSNSSNEEGIVIESAQNVSVLDVDFVSNSTGIFILSSTTINLENLNFLENTHFGVLTQLSDGIKAQKICMQKNSALMNASFFGFGLVDSSNIVVNSYVFSNNSADSGNLGAFSVDNTNNVKLNHALISDNTPSNLFDGVLLTNGAQNATFNDVVVAQNNTEGTLRGFAVQESSAEITFNNCQSHLNSSSSSTAAGFSIDNSSKVSHFNCLASENNSDASNVSGFTAGGTDVLYDNCVSTSNFSNGTLTEARGFNTFESTKITYQSCIANDNVATGTGYGFRLGAPTGSTLLNNIANNNQGFDVTTGVGRGIFMTFDINCLVQGNITQNNSGGMMDVGIEIQGNGGNFTTAVFGNRSQNHDVNYSTGGTFMNEPNILRVTYNTQDTTLSAQPTVLDNIDIFNS